MINIFIDSALIIDDKNDEIIGLRQLLESKDIWIKHYLPNELLNRTSPLRNRKIIFLDLYIDGKVTEVRGQIALIRKIFEKAIGLNYGTYGIVLWSRHNEEIDELKSKMQQDAEKYTLPLFIVGLDKNIYLADGYNKLFEDLNKTLQTNPAANFFIHWNSLVDQGKDKAISNIYSLFSDYKKQENNLQYVLFQMAKNYTGIPIDQIQNYQLNIDALKAFNDIMNYEILSDQTISYNIFDDYSNICYISETGQYKKRSDDKYLFEDNILDLKDEQLAKKHGEKIGKLNKQINIVFSRINSKLMLDEINIHQDTVIPGNIYEINETPNHFISINKPDKAKPIIIEMTPPCDFSNNKMIYSRVMGGFIYDYTKKTHENYKKDNYYSEIWPLFIKGKDECQMMIYDFGYFGFVKKDDLKNSDKYKILFRTKDKLFADILQKLSSHTARLGLSIIH